HAFHITTSAPVVAYDIFPYGGGNSAVTSATLLLPTSAWDTSYVAVDAWEKAHRPMNGSDSGGNDSPPFLELVAQQNATHVTIPPIHGMGSRYAAIRYPNRFGSTPESPPWRIMGGADGTTLTYEPSQPPGAPSTLSFGQLAIFNAPGPFIVKSQDDDHPFYMS